MKRLLASTAVLALGVAAIAQASSTKLTGTTDGGGKIAMTFSSNAFQKLKDFRFHDVPIQCAHGKFTVAVDLTGQTFQLDSQGAVRERVTPPGTRYAKLRIKAAVRDGGARAHGGLRLRGRGIHVEERSKPQSGCDTGRILWTAFAPL
jgi:hypothetical protein